MKRLLRSVAPHLLTLKPRRRRLKLCKFLEMQTLHFPCCTVFLLLCLFFFPSCCTYVLADHRSRRTPPMEVKVGLILNMSSIVGKIGSLCLELAIEDFNSEGIHTKTLRLLPRDSHHDALAAAAAGIDLLKNFEVEAIIGPQYSEEAEFIANLGGRAHVPILSFSATSPMVSPTETPYFVRAAQDDSFQADAVTAVVDSQGWRGIVLVYEDSNYGRGMIPYLADAFQGRAISVNQRVLIPPFASEVYVERELYRLKTMQTRVFVVHMSSGLGSKFFHSVQKLGMMSVGYAWILTNGMGNLLDNLDRVVLESMQGVVAIRTHVPRSKQLEDFKLRWENKSEEKLNASGIQNPHLNVYGLWAYDTIRALGSAIEASNAGTSKFRYPNRPSRNSSDPFALGVSPTGPNLLEEIKKTSFSGLSGDFELGHGELGWRKFEVVNIVKNQIVEVGSWMPSTGLRSRAVNSSDIGPFLTWSGGTRSAPKGWVVPTEGHKLKILVPVKDGFIEFVKVQETEPKVSGYSIDVFNAVVEKLPYDLSYDFIPGPNNWPYDRLIDMIHDKKYDALVGDVTIRANRSRLVDFTQPYSDSGVSMIVTVEANNRKKASVFLEPLTLQLWLVWAIFFVFTGTVIWVLEHRINPNFRGPPSEQIGLIFYYAFSTMVFAHTEKLASNLARVVVVVWVFVVLILTSSYTASLASILTVGQLQPAETDLQTLIDTGRPIGFQSGSFVKKMLLQMNAREGQVLSLDNERDYAECLANGTVSAIVDEIPYIKLFLSKYCSGRFVMAGRTYKTDGFGIVFPKGSPLVSDLSQAILNVTEGDQMDRIEKAWLGTQTDCSGGTQQQLTSISLPLYSFRGLFLLTGTVSIGAVIVFFFLFWLDYLRSDRPTEKGFIRKLRSMFHHFDDKDLSSHQFRSERERRVKETMRRKSSKVYDVSLVENDPEDDQLRDLATTDDNEVRADDDPTSGETNTHNHGGSVEIVLVR